MVPAARRLQHGYRSCTRAVNRLLTAGTANERVREFFPNWARPGCTLSVSLSGAAFPAQRSEQGRVAPQGYVGVKLTPVCEPCRQRACQEAFSSGASRLATFAGNPSLDEPITGVRFGQGLRRAYIRIVLYGFALK